MPPELGGQVPEMPKFEMPPEYRNAPEPTTTMISNDKHLQLRVKESYGSVMTRQKKANEVGFTNKQRFNSLLMESIGQKIPLSY